jgi:hypothetical protein
MRNITGNNALGNDFFDRKHEIARYWDKLETDNLLLLAPRRVGKTSIMKTMASDANRHGFAAVYVDVSDSENELRFVQKVWSSLLSDCPDVAARDQLSGWLKNTWAADLVKTFKKAGGYGFSIEIDAGQGSWQQVGEEVSALLGRVDARCLIFIDELPVFVLKLLGDGSPAGVDRVHQFLYWLRTIRQKFPIRWMLAGSVGLDTVAARINVADAINDLHIEKLDGFSHEVADDFLQALAASYGIKLGPNVRMRLLERVGSDRPIPYYLQLMFDQLRQIGNEPAVADVDAAVENLLRPAHKNYFDYWRQRLFDELGRADAESAIHLLNRCCYEPGGELRSTLSLSLAGTVADPGQRENKLRFLLDVLQNDGYLLESERERWCFYSPLLRAFWMKRVAPPPATGASQGER